MENNIIAVIVALSQTVDTFDSRDHFKEIDWYVGGHVAIK